MMNGSMKMEKNLIVELRLKSGKRYTFETDAFKQGQLEQLIEDVEFRGSGYFAVDETLFVRWSEIESFEDVTHFQSDSLLNGHFVGSCHLRSH